MSTSAEALRTAIQVHEGGDWLRAARLYTEIIQANPRHPEALHRFGMLCMQIGKQTDAREMLHRALECGEAQSACDYRTALAISYLSEGRVAEALAECELARAVSTTASLVLVQGKAFRQLGDTDQACRCFCEGVAAYPGDIALRLELAETQFAAGQWNDAANSFELVLDLDAKQPNAMQRLTEMMLAEEIAIGDHWINRLRLTLNYASDDGMRNSLRRQLAACHAARGELEQADAVSRQIR